MMRLESLLTLSLFLFGDSYVCAASTSRGLSRDAENKVGCAGTPLDKLFKFEIGSYKRDNVTWDQYANYLVKVHDARARPVIKRHGVSIWTQVRPVLSLSGRRMITYWAPPSASINCQRNDADIRGCRAC